MIFQLILDRRIQDFKIPSTDEDLFCDEYGKQLSGQSYGSKALVRRFWICELSFSPDLWLDWAKTTSIKNIYDYLCQNPDEILLKPGEDKFPHFLILQVGTD